ncbi:PDZ domain-containing protein [Bacteroidaceae bacterium 14-104]|nr:PDZ domain-containing protein [Phocaeicola oris]
MASCFGEDRTEEYNNLVSDDKWIDEVLEKYYLWNDSLTEVSESDYFNDANDFLAKRVYKKALDGKGDTFSYIEWKDTISTRVNINRTSGYGFEFEVMTDPLRTTAHTMARVLYVMPNSPASEAGLKRGDWITAVGGDQLTVNNYTKLIDGDATSLSRSKIVYDQDSVRLWKSLDIVPIGKSRFVELNPFYLDSVYTIDNQKIAYMVYNEFSTGPKNQSGETEYGNRMLNIFERFKAIGTDTFILDLRYNSGGYLTCAQELASLLVPASALGKTFCTLKYNETGNLKDETILLDPKYQMGNLNLNKLYIITSRYTASASEAVINCLKPYFGKDNIIVVGETTYGKPVGMQAFNDEKHKFIIWPVVAYILNAENTANYNNGIAPNYELNERKLIDSLYPLGDTREYLLHNTLALITTGSVSNKSYSFNNNTTTILQTSLNKHNKRGIIIH